MRGEAVPQGVRMNVLVWETGAASRGPAHVPDRLVGDRLVHSTMAAAAREQVDSRPSGAPVLAQGIVQPGAEHDVAVPTSFSALDMDNHAPAIDVADLQRRHFRPAGSGSVERHQHGALKGCSVGINKTRHFFRAKDFRQADDLPRIGRLGNTPVPLENLDIEEPKCTQPCGYGVRAVLQLAEQHRLVLATRLAAALSQAWPTALSKRLLNGALEGNRGTFSVFTPQSGQRTRYSSTTTVVRYSKHGRSRTSRS